MRIRAAALLILTLTTSCTRGPRPDHPSTTTASPTLAVAPPTTAGAVSSGEIATPVPAPPTSGLPEAPETSTTPSGANASSAATRIVDQLIGGLAIGTVPDVDLWVGVVTSGRIIQTTVLAESADRATAAVSVAFDGPGTRTGIEPIALRVELLHTSAGWTVTAIGYL